MRKTALVAAIAAFASPAFAHHPLAGAPMETFGHGILSGIGHPVLGFDHLFFIVAIGIAAAYTGRLLMAPLGYVAGMLAGVGLILAGVALPAVEVVIACSLLVAGVVLMMGRKLALPVYMALFGLLGLFHGWAFGAALAGQEGGAALSVTIGYLLGLAVVQWGIAVAAGWTIKRVAASAGQMAPRLAGGMVAGAGLFLVLEAAEGAALAALGLG